jgi:microcystin degradation protein MlrC
VALTALPNAFLDPGYFRAMGLDPGAMDVVVVRSGYHFTLNFAATGECITVDTPGMTGYRVAELPFKVAGPFYPLHPDVVFTPQVQVRRRPI